jgi:O-antigen ligase
VVRAALCSAGLNERRGRPVVRAIAAAALFVATLLIASFNEHDPYDIVSGHIGSGLGLAARDIAGLVPLLAALVVALCVLRPRIGLLAVLLLTPVVNVAQICWLIIPVQVIAQTIFSVALAVGLVLRDPQPAPAVLRPGAESPVVRAGWRSRVSLPVVAATAMISMLTLATLSTAMSPDRVLSATILLHGILEPASMALFLLLVRPTKRYLVWMLVAMAVSVGIGGLLNIVQTVPAMGWSLSVLQTNRLYFSRLTYFNVGLFGEMLAMTTPFLLALLLAIRLGYCRLPRLVVAALIATIPVDLASLFLTFSKSGYLAAFGGCIVLVLLLVGTRRNRIKILLAITLLSAVVIPWPAFFLQVVPPVNSAYRSAMVSLMGESRFDSWNPSTLSGRGSLLERWYATEAGLRMAVDHPLLGIGLDQFQGQYVGHYRPPEAKLAVDWAHSMFPEVAAELGIPALLLDLILYGSAMLALWRVYRAPPDQLTRMLACALLASLVAWLLVGTAFAGDMYRPWRYMADDYVMMMVIAAASFSLYWMTKRGTAVAAGEAEPTAEPIS